MMEALADARALKRIRRRRVIAVTVYNRYSGERSKPYVHNASEDVRDGEAKQFIDSMCNAGRVCRQRQN